MCTKSTVFIVDDDQAIRTALETAVRSVGWESKGFASAESFLDSLDETPAGCLVIDMRLPGMSGLELLDHLRAQGIQLPVIIITGYGDVSVAVRSMRHGAFDFLEKPFSLQLLLDRVRDSLKLEAAARAESDKRAAIEQRLSQLTKREREVMDHVAAGKASKEIAAELGISKKTVDVHRSHIIQKLQVDSLAELVELALTARESGKAVTGSTAAPHCGAAGDISRASYLVSGQANVSTPSAHDASFSLRPRAQAHIA